MTKTKFIWALFVMSFARSFCVPKLRISRPRVDAISKFSTDSRSSIENGNMTTPDWEPFKNHRGGDNPIGRPFNVTIPEIYLDSNYTPSKSPSSFVSTSKFMARAAGIGILTGISVDVFKSAILGTQFTLYEILADALPKPAFYWPLVLYPFIGSLVVAVISQISGAKMKYGIDWIAKSIDAAPLRETHLQSISRYQGTEREKDDDHSAFDPSVQFLRLSAAVATLGSGCSLGPEGESGRFPRCC